MPTTTGYEFGGVVLVPSPFTDQTGTKQRPAVVISSEPVRKSPNRANLPTLKSQAMVGQASVPAWPRRQGRLRHQVSNFLTDSEF